MTVLTSSGCAANSSKDVFQSYVNAWQNQDFQGMYEKLSAEVKGRITQEQFVKRYQDVYSGIEVTKLSVKPQFPDKIKPGKDGKVQIPYNVSMDTLAGKVEFSSQATLTQEKGEKGKVWVLDWTSKMIFPQLGDGDKVRSQVVAAKRGEIKDKNGAGLALNGKVVSIGVVPEKMGQNPGAVQAQLAQSLNLTVEEISKKLNQSWVKPGLFVPITRLSVEDKDKISKAVAIPGVLKKDEDARLYPLKAAAAQLTGYIGTIGADELEKLKGQGYRSSSQIGKTGLEQVFEKRLKGEDGGIIYLEDSNGNRKETIGLGEQPGI